jgi:putative flavoprotein involved in K+ transport
LGISGDAPNFAAHQSWIGRRLEPCFDDTETGEEEVTVNRASSTERIQTVVIGAGQAGLSVGYHLSRRGLPFVILEGNQRVGDSWRARWDSLRLFTPARFDGLAGLPFPAPPYSFPTKDEMADYLESYAAHFSLPVRTGTRVDRLTETENGFRIVTGNHTIEAENVVVAMSNFQKPRIPASAAELDPAIVQLHSSEYRNPDQLREGNVLIVGAGNSGADIAMDLSGRHRILLAGRDTGQVPFRIERPIARLLMPPLFRVAFHRVLSVRTPMGRRLRPKVLTVGGPRIRVKSSDLYSAGVERAPRFAGVRDGRPALDDGRALDVANVIWCTGFEPGFSSWIDLPVFGDVEPLHERGIVASQPGLYFVGLHFLTALSSVMIHGVGRDAAHIATAIAARAHQPAGPLGRGARGRFLNRGGAATQRTAAAAL